LLEIFARKRENADNSRLHSEAVARYDLSADREDDDDLDPLLGLSFAFIEVSSFGRAPRCFVFFSVRKTRERIQAIKNRWLGNARVVTRRLSSGTVGSCERWLQHAPSETETRRCRPRAKAAASIIEPNR